MNIKKTSFLGIIAGILFASTSFSQEIKKCSHVEESNHYIQQLSPAQLNAYKLEQENFESQYQIDLNEAQQKSGLKNTKLVIPVVFHVLHENGTENISDQQIFDQMRILNEEFNLERTYGTPTISQFEGIQGSSNIVFRLAQLDPNGNCTNGIDRIQTSLTNNAGENSKLNPWPRRRYMNVWIVKTIGSNAAGYTYTPNNFFPPVNRDGIIILHNYIGSIGTGNENRSSTLTHEVGHWLNLLHPWGGTNEPGLQSNCNDDDGVQDTPNTIGWTSCNLNGQSCGSLDNVQNHMDYSYCSTMFTQGQATRMRTALNSSVAERNNLHTLANLALTGTDGLASSCVTVDFYSDKQSVCAGETINFFDPLDKGQTAWAWQFPGGTPSTSTDRNPSIVYNQEGVFPVTLTISDNFNSRSKTITQYIAVVPKVSMPFVENFSNVNNFPEHKWYPNSQDANINWEVSTSVGFNDLKSAKLDNFNLPAGRTVNLNTSAIDMRWNINASLTFKVAYAQKNSSNNDVLRVRISNNCGETWAIRGSRSGGTLATAPPTTSPFVPNGESQWQTITINNIPNTYMTENFRVQFSFESAGGNNIYIDDVNITSATVGTNFNAEEGFGFKVYPNPYEDNSQILLETDKNIKSANIYITDMLGRNVASIYQGNIMSGQNFYQLSNYKQNLSSGIYLINMDLDGKRLTDKLIVK
jgi:PKD repeat protein